MAEQSRNEEILRSIIDETEYDKTPQSREEELLLELKQAIEGGGSSVVPNPEGEATETLNKLGIDDTVYGIPKELPAVTSADAGNVLGVNSEGQWTKMAASGGGTQFVKYTITASGGNYGNLNDNKTLGDIKRDYEAGKMPYVVDNFNQIFYLMSAYSGYVFVLFKFQNNRMNATFMTFSGNDSVKKPSMLSVNFAPAT